MNLSIKLLDIVCDHLIREFALIENEEMVQKVRDFQFAVHQALKDGGE